METADCLYSDTTEFCIGDLGDGPKVAGTGPAALLVCSDCKGMHVLSRLGAETVWRPAALCHKARLPLPYRRGAWHAVGPLPLG